MTHAANIVYTLQAGSTGNFSGAAWTPSVPSNNPGDIISDPVGSNPVASTVTLDVDVTVGQVRINTSGGHTSTFNSDGTHFFTLDGTGLNNQFGIFNSAAIVQVANAGALTVAPNIVLANTDLDLGTITAGTLVIGTLGTNTITASTPQALNFRGTGSGVTTINSFIGGSGSNIALSNFKSAGTVNLVGGLGSKVTSITQNGTSTLTLTGNYANSGPVTVALGTFNLTGGANTIGALSVDGILDLQNGQTTNVNGLSGAGSIITANGGGTARNLIVGNNDATATYAGTIVESTTSRPFNLTKVGSGTQTLTGLATIGTGTGGGAVTVNGGALALDFSPAGGVANDIIATSGSSIRSLILSGGRLNVIGADGETNSQMFSGLFTNTGAARIDATPGSGGTATVIVTGVPARTTAQNTAFVGGTLRIGTTGTVRFSNTLNSPLLADTQGNPWVTFGTDDWAATNATGDVIAATYAPAAGAFTAGGNNTVVGDVALVGTTDIASLRFADTTPYTISGNATFTARGILVASDSAGGVISASFIRPARSSNAGSTLSLIQHSTVGNLEISGALVDGSTNTPVAITKSGAGTVIFSGAGGNSYTGQTFVNAGTLLVNNATGSGTSTNIVNVGISGTIGGTGIIAPGASNNILVAAGATIAPGSGGLGTLTIDSLNTGATSVLSLGSGAIFRMELGAGLQADRVSLLNGTPGDFAFANNVVNFTDLTGGILAAGNYTLFSADTAGAYSGLTFSGNTIIGGLTIGSGLASYGGSTLQIDGNNIVLAVVPEPGAFLSLLGGFGTLAGLRRFRRRH